jgi:hypothetical protein
LDLKISCLLDSVVLNKEVQVAMDLVKEDLLLGHSK